ncbi:MAG: hypothetical protein EBS79_02825 [Gammaproteobacteria bacterium]|nr:hypothetical protein [Gammaproteobacteria bacterium]
MHSTRGDAWSIEKYKEALSAFKSAQSANSEGADRWRKEIGYAKKRIEAIQEASRGPSSSSPGKAQDKTDPRVLRWAARNPWFGNDKSMTDFAIQKGHELSRDGYEPGSDAFFRNIDLAVREQFPSHFQRNNASPTIDPKAEQWAARNPWFGQRKDMTDYAMSIHKSLIERGVDPESDEYYRIIDASMRKKFSSYFN